MRVVLYGAGGKVGRQVLQHLLLNNTDPALDLVLVARNKNRVVGAIADIESTVPLHGPRNNVSRVIPRQKTTSDPADMKDARLVVVTACNWPTAEQKAAWKQADPTGQLIQAHVNRALVEKISREIATHAPDAHVIIATSPPDMMAEVARTILAPEKVLGFGGAVDSARLRRLSETAIKALKTPYTFVYEGHMIGYSNDDMIPIASSLAPALIKEGLLKNTLAETRVFSAKVSSLQRDFNNPQDNPGAAVLPGYALYAAITAFTGAGPPFREPFNARLPAAAAEIYGVPENSALSIPVAISSGGYKPSMVYKGKIRDAEKEHLRAAQKRMEQACARLMAAPVNTVRLPPGRSPK